MPGDISIILIWKYKHVIMDVSGRELSVVCLEAQTNLGWRPDMTRTSDLKQIRQMLSAGHVTVPDSATGYHRALYARCPKDGHRSSVHRIDRSGVAITRVVFRCPVCSGQFDVPPENMLLR